MDLRAQTPGNICVPVHDKKRFARPREEIRLAIDLRAQGHRRSRTHGGATLGALLLLALLALTLLPSAASGGTGLFYQAVDADNAHDGGVYYRRSPNWNDTARITGVGVYYEETVELVCGAWGEAVGPRANRRWHLLDNASRPSAGRGWIPDRYLNTPNVANQLTPGEPECGSGSPPPPPAPIGSGSVYYAPDGGGGSPATFTMAYGAWRGGPDCGTAKADDFPTQVGNRRLTTLAGFSVGRLGPIYFLRQNPGRRASITYILLFDPGSLSDYRSRCDRWWPQSQLLAQWLSVSPNNRVAILAGRLTRDWGTRNGRFAHQGIQETLFPRIRGRAIAAQVTVCNYDAMGHWQVFNNFKHKMNEAPIRATTCPVAADGTRPNASWHP